MSIYFALEYDENGVSRIVEKKDTSTRAINKRDFKFGSYVGNQITSPEDPNQPDEGDTNGDFISQMGTGTMGGNEMTNYERFIDRSNLTAFMNEGKGPKDTKFINAIFAAMGVPVTAEGLTKFFDGITKFLPKESPEVTAIRKFYATEGLRYMNPNSPDYIPGMENYNIVYGGFPGIKDPSIGLQDALGRRSENIIDTLKNKYGFNDIEIKQIQMGTYTGTKGYNEIMGKQTNLIPLLTDITKFKKIEKDYIDNIPTDEVAGTGGVDQIDITAPGAGTITGPNIDEEEGRPDDPSGGGSFDPGGGFVDQGGYGEFGPPPKNDNKPKDTPDYSNVRTGGGSPGQRSKDDKTSGDFPGKGSGNPFGR
jgi:hypothetical protein